MEDCLDSIVSMIGAQKKRLQLTTCFLNCTYCSMEDKIMATMIRFVQLRFFFVSSENITFDNLGFFVQFHNEHFDSSIPSHFYNDKMSSLVIFCIIILHLGWWSPTSPLIMNINMVILKEMIISTSFLLFYC